MLSFRLRFLHTLKYNHCTRSHLHGSFIDLAIFPIKSITGQISGIHHFLPLHPLWQIRKRDIPGFPVKIIACIKEIILTSVRQLCICPAQHHADHAAGIFHVAEPCTFPMKRHIRESLAKVICFFHALTHMKDRMSLPKCNCLFYKGEHTGISPQSPPVNPANGIILTVSIVISLLGIADLITAIDHGHSLGKQQHGKSSTHLALPHLTDPLLPAWSFNTAIPGIIIAAAVVIAFPICLIVLIIVGNKVI